MQAAAFGVQAGGPRPPVRARRAILAVAALVLAGAAHAEPSLPWTPSAQARHWLQWLVDEAGLDLTLTQWPLPRHAVRHALDRLPSDLAPALQDARRQVLDELKDAAGASMTLALRNPGERLAGFGEDATPGSAASFRSPAFEGARVVAQLGVRAERAAVGRSEAATFRLEGSAVATELFGVQLQAWSRRSWWGPGWQSSLALSDNAPALNGVGVQRSSASTSESPSLAWLGPWNFEFLLAQLEDVDVPADPYLIGMRLTLRPWAPLEIGLTRTAQWGGEGRRRSLGSCFDALTGTGLNPSDEAGRARDPANQLAGVDARLRCPSWLNCAAYLQMIGEDEAGGLPSSYLGLYGVEVWSGAGRHRWFAELLESGCKMPVLRTGTRPCAYRNYAYPEGYVSAHRWLGAGSGPDSRLLTLGWLNTDWDATLRLYHGRIGSRIGSFSAVDRDPQTSGRLTGVTARREMTWGRLRFTPEFGWLRLSAPAGTSHDVRVGLTMDMMLGDGADP
ncbi:MAG: capsule assembly Wzi family protein [Methylibium sp.]|nr:capsule assembly Wzi family protein [Methylibium sp.]